MHQTHSNTTWPFNLPTQFKGEDFYQPISAHVCGLMWKILWFCFEVWDCQLVLSQKVLWPGKHFYSVALLMGCQSVTGVDIARLIPSPVSVHTVHSLQSLCLSTPGITTRLASQLFGPLLKKLSLFTPIPMTMLIIMLIVHCTISCEEAGLEVLMSVWYIFL